MHMPIEATQLVSRYMLCNVDNETAEGFDNLSDLVSRAVSFDPDPEASYAVWSIVEHMAGLIADGRRMIAFESLPVNFVLVVTKKFEKN